jgi:hypothetical protein
MSEKPFVREFEMPDGRVFASVVMDREDFETLIDELLAAEVEGLTPEMAANVKKIGHIPMMARGTKTEFVFERFELSCNLLSMIIRGQGRKIAEQVLGGVAEAIEDKMREHVRRQIESN